MVHNKMIAMILAGGRGTRLEDLTSKVAKPAVFFGGKYRIIDFPLSNCANSGIDVVGVLTQYESVLLNSYVAQDSRWGLDAKDSGIYVLPPREKVEGFGLYRGTADAITQNLDFCDQFSPDYILILSGDHIYKMDYSWMLDDHIRNNADVTIAVLEVPKQEASRFGIMNCDKHDRIVEFEEKPPQPKSNLASMGIYIFDYKLLKRYLLVDEKNQNSTHDFGKDIIPTLLLEGKKLYAHRFKGYWKDVGTLDSLWEANMDLLGANPNLRIEDKDWKIYTEDVSTTGQYLLNHARLKNSMINQGCVIDGQIENSVIFTDVIVKKDAVIKDSVILPNVVIGKEAQLARVIVGEGVVIPDKMVLGNPNSSEVELIVQRKIKKLKGGQ